MPLFPFRVVLNICHNHPLLAGDVLRHRDVGPEAAAKITRLLQMNHSPAAALDILKYDLQDEHPDDYLLYAGDRHHCPDLQWCYRCVSLGITLEVNSFIRSKNIMRSQCFSNRMAMRKSSHPPAHMLVPLDPQRQNLAWRGACFQYIFEC